MYHLVSAPLTGVSQPTGWAQVISHPQQSFVCALSLAGEQAHQIGRELTDFFLQSTPQTALEVHQLAEHFLQRSQAAHLQFQFAAQLLTETSSVICTYQGFVYLRRAHKIGLILPVQSQVQIVEGNTHSDDVYVLGTAAATVYEQSLQRILVDVQEPEAFVTQLMQHVLQTTDSSLVAITYVKIEPDVAPFAAPPEASNMAVKADSTNTSPIVPSVAKKIIQGCQTAILGMQRMMQPLFSRDVYVRKQGTKKAVKIILPIVVGLIVILGAMMFIRAQQAKQVAAAAVVLQPAQTELALIKDIAGSQPLEARQRTEALIAMLEGKLPEFQQQKTAQNVIQKELEDVRNFYQTISGQQEVNVLPTFFDLRLFQSDFLANRMNLQQNSIFFLDPDKKQILALEINSKKTTLLPLGQLANLKDFTVNEQNVFLLGGGIFRFTLGSNTNATLLKNPDLDTEPTTAIRSYGDYIYLLHPDKRNIFRYQVEDDNQVSSPAAWLKADERFDVTTVQSIAIDGDIWVATKTGEIHRFSSGRLNDITIVGLKEAFSSPLKIYTKDGLEHIYLLEPAKNRVVVIKKDGTFVKEVRSSTLASASDLVANEANRTIYVLSGSLVYEVQF